MLTIFLQLFSIFSLSFSAALYANNRNEVVCLKEDNDCATNNTHQAQNNGPQSLTLPSLSGNHVQNDLQNAPSSGQRDALPNTAAQWVTQVGQAFNNGDARREAASSASGYVSGSLSREVTNWLSQGGTFRANVGVDNKSRMNNYTVESLIPLFQSEDWLPFIQLGFNREDDRNQLNVGTGLRRFSDGNMFGGNLFWDHDFTQYHSRMGVGLEYWRDYFKLGANGYYRLTNWRNDKRLEDYESRPANGWDVRLQGWLPVWPSLGGKFVFEKYYGESVGLFGKDKRQKDPHALTAGLNYTPIPLITLSAEHKRGQDSANDSRFGLDFSYRFGMPWEAQIRTDEVNALKLLKNSRYDLVDRNNNIVLEYKKKQVISLSSIASIAGYAGEIRNLDAKVKTKYALDRIEWDASEIMAQGGRVIRNSVSNYSVQLPRYRFDSGAKNTYTLRGVAWDVKGNHSKPAVTQLSVEQPALSAEKSRLYPQEAGLPADGKSTFTFKVYMRDEQDNPVDVNEKEMVSILKSRSRAPVEAKLSSLVRLQKGEYQLQVTSGLRPEELSLSVNARKMDVKHALVKINSDKDTAVIPEDGVTLIKDNALANGVDKDVFRVQVIDKQGNAVEGVPVEIKAPSDTVVATTAITAKSGTVDIPVQRSVSGPVTISAKTVTGKDRDITLHFVADKSQAVIEKGSLKVLQNGAIADGSAKNLVQLRVTDQSGNPIADYPVKFSLSGEASIISPDVRTDADGLAQAEIVSLAAGKYVVTGVVNKSEESVEIEFSGHAMSAQITEIKISHNEQIADGKTPVHHFAVVKDANGNLLEGIPVHWSADEANVLLNDKMSLTDKEGTAKTFITSSKALTTSVLAQVGTSSMRGDTVTFKANLNEPAVAELVADKNKFIANGKDVVRVTASITDKMGNLLSDHNVTWTANGGGTLIPESGRTDEKGKVSALVTSTRAGLISITATPQGGTSASVSVTAEYDARSAVVTLTSNKTVALADDKDEIEFTAKVVDANDNVISGMNVYWNATYNALSETSTLTDKDGYAKVRLKGTRAGQTQVESIIGSGSSSTLLVNLLPMEADKAESSFTLYPTVVVANGKSSEARLELKDKYGNRVPGQHVSFGAREPGSGISISNIKETDKGVYTGQITGTKEGSYVIVATLNGTASFEMTADIGVTADSNSASLKSVIIDGKNVVIADGQDETIVRAQVVDANNNTQIPGVAIGWKTDLGFIDIPVTYTDDSGVAMVKIRSRQAGTAQVTAVLGQTEMAASRAVEFRPDVVSGSQTTLKVTPERFFAGKNATVQVVVKDKQGNPIGGLANEIQANATRVDGISLGSFDEIGGGIYEAKVSGTQAGVYRLSASVMGEAIEEAPSFWIDANIEDVKGSISVNQLSALVGEAVTYTAELTDEYSNPLGKGYAITWDAGTGTDISKKQTFTDMNGKSSVSVTREQAGDAVVKALLLNGTTVAAETVHFNTADYAADNSELTMTRHSIIANGNDFTEMLFYAKDRYGNPVTGLDLTGETSFHGVTFSSAVETSTGVYSIKVSSKQAGVADLGVSINGVEFEDRKTLTLEADKSTWMLTPITISRAEITAGDEGVRFDTRVVDANDNPLSGEVVSWTLTAGRGQYERVTYTDKDGRTSLALTTNEAGVLKMQAWLDPQHSGMAPDVNVIAGEIDNKTSVFEADKSYIGSDGDEKVTFDLKLNDAYGNAISDQKIDMKQKGGRAGLQFSDTYPTEVSPGHYQIMATSVVKGITEVEAWVGQTQIAQSISIETGAITPELSFDQEHQKVVWTRAYANSQPVKGVPAGVPVQWSSSDESVVRVDKAGVITLLKAGKAHIYAQSGANEQFNPSTASYEIEVLRAKPGLTADQNLIVATWGDGIDAVLTSSFSNDDAKDLIDVAFRSDDENIVTAGNDGKLQQKRPGVTLVHLTTPSTEQFEPEDVAIPYTLNKATVKLDFVESTVKTADTSALEVQPFTELPPKDVVILWTSSNPEVVSIMPSGKITSVQKGQTVLTATIAESEFYSQSSSAYTVEVYSKPQIALTNISYKSNGVEKQDVWNPVLRSDVATLSLTQTVTDKYAPVKTLNVQLIDSDGSVLENWEQNSPSGDVTIDINPKTSYWEHDVHFRVSALGEIGLSTELILPDIHVKNLSPKEFIEDMTAVLDGQILLATGTGEALSCRAIGELAETNYLKRLNLEKITFTPKGTLLAPVNIKLSMLESSRELPLGSAVIYDAQGATDGIRKTAVLKADCYNTDGGDDLRIKAEFEYAGNRSSVISETKEWSGQAVTDDRFVSFN